MNNKEKFLLSVNEAADYFSIGRSKFRRIIERPDFPAKRIVDCRIKIIKPLAENYFKDNLEIFT